MQLSTLQELLCRSLYEEDNVAVKPYILLNGIAVDKRLEIYKNTLFTNLINVLKSIYPVICRVVGESFFRFAAKEYIKSYPSTAGNLEEYGGRMAEFLAGFQPALGLPYLSDIARLEWAVHQAYHAGDGGRINVAELQGVSLELYQNIRFILHPSCQIIASPYAIYTIWQVAQEGYEGGQAVDNRVGEYVMVVRDSACVVRIVALNNAEYRFLYCLQSGKSLGVAYEEAEKSADYFNLSEMVRKNIANNVFVAYVFSL